MRTTGRTEEEQLGWEARAGRIAGAAAAISALLALASGIIGASLIGEERTIAARLVALNGNEGGFLTVALVRALGFGLLAVPLSYLFTVARARRPDLPRWLGWFIAGAPVAVALAFLLSQIIVEPNAAKEFVASGARTTERARELLREESSLLSGLLSGLVIALAAAILMTNVVAMRVGLLSRFMGFLGVLVGMLTVIPIAEYIPLFWLFALAALLAGRWPGGRGPAWQVVQAIPWPRAAEQRAEIERRRAEREEATAGEPAASDPDTPR